MLARSGRGAFETGRPRPNSPALAGGLVRGAILGAGPQSGRAGQEWGGAAPPRSTTLRELPGRSGRNGPIRAGYAGGAGLRGLAILAPSGERRRWRGPGSVRDRRRRSAVFETAAPPSGLVRMLPGAGWSGPIPDVGRG